MRRRPSSGGHFYPRPPRGGRLQRSRLGRHNLRISTHALREEGDLHFLADLGKGQISTHALREEGDGAQTGQGVSNAVFLPTPSARRATRRPQGRCP